MMPIYRALIRLKRRRALALIGLIALSAWVCVYYQITIPWTAEHYPQLSSPFAVLILLGWVGAMMYGVWYSFLVTKGIWILDKACKGNRYPRTVNLYVRIKPNAFTI